MLNQTSFKLASTLPPSTYSGKVTQVLNKKNSDGEYFYPSFVDETVVITNEAGSIMETTKASCDGSGNISFTLRGISDDETGEASSSREMSWNPGAICFVTVGAGDLVSRAEFDALEARVEALEGGGE